MITLASVLKDVKSVAIAGHIRPDGDCTGSCLAVYSYLREHFPQIEADVYLEAVAPVFQFLKYADQVKTTCTEEKTYDLFLALDTSDRERLGEAARYFDTAKHTVCVDHHISNSGYGEVNVIVPDASATAEVVFDLLEEEKISKACAEGLYMGIVHDTGVFQYSNTSRKTMEIAGKLMEKGIPFTEIIDKTFYKKTYVQNQILGRTLMESILLLDGKCIIGRLKKKDLEFYQVTPKDLDGIVNQLRVTEGVEVAVFLYEIGNHEYKVSLRSNGCVDVNQVAGYFGGGGHIKAAGCTMHGTIYDVINNLTLHIEHQLLQEKDQ